MWALSPGRDGSSLSGTFDTAESPGAALCADEVSAAEGAVAVDDDELVDDGPSSADGDDDETDPESGSALATADVVAAAAPIPKATASAPTRPMCLA